MKFLKYVTALLCVTPLCIQAMEGMEEVQLQQMAPPPYAQEAQGESQAAQQQQMKQLMAIMQVHAGQPQQQQVPASAPGPKSQVMSYAERHDTIGKRASNLCCNEETKKNCCLVSCAWCCCTVCCCPCTGCLTTSYLCCNDSLTREIVDESLLNKENHERE